MRSYPSERLQWGEVTMQASLPCWSPRHLQLGHHTLPPENAYSCGSSRPVKLHSLLGTWGRLRLVTAGVLVPHPGIEPELRAVAEWSQPLDRRQGNHRDVIVKFN